nr:hypothetical protein [Tanacetum cinerariifolium]
MDCGVEAVVLDELGALLPFAEEILMYQQMEEEEVGATKKIMMLLKYLEYQTHLLEEAEVVAVKVETQKEFLVSHVSFFSSGELLPDLIGVGFDLWCFVMVEVVVMEELLLS